MLNMKNAIVFGGSGFLGSHICDHLTESGFKVTIFDKNKSRFIKKNQKMIIGDISDLEKVSRAIKKQKYVYHFAGISDIDESNSNPMRAIKFNILGTANILESIKKNKKVNRIIFASSIYARSEQGGFYSLTKRSCESLIEEYSKKFNINFTILRFGSLYGLRANNFNTINQFIKQGISNKKIERIGEGKEIRNYINVKDAAKVCIKILKRNNANKYFNIIGSEKISVKSVINLISKKIGIQKIIYHKRKIPDHHYKINPFTYKVREGKFIKIKNPVKFESGIEEIINKFI